MKRLFFAVLCPVLAAAGVARAADDITLEPLTAAAGAPGAPTIQWVKDGDLSWKDAAPLYTQQDAARGTRADVRIVADAAALHLCVVVGDDQHVGSHGGRDVWRNDCVRLGVDARGDGARGRPRDSRVIGVDDASFTFALTESGTATWIEIHGAVDGFGDRPDIPLKIVRDEAARVTTYDITLPWEEFGLTGCVTPSVGLAVYVCDADPGKEISTLRWDASAQESWDDRAICGVYKPGLFRRIRIADPDHPVAAVSVTNRMLSEGDPAAEAWLLTSGGAADAVHVKLGSTAQMLVLPAGEGTRRFVLSARPERRLAGSTEFSVALVKDGRTIAEQQVTARSDYESDWYAFMPENNTGPSAIGMEDWIEAPAGKHGVVRMAGDHFEFDDGTRVKFWGTNIGPRTFLSSGRGLRTREMLTEFARQWRKYGVNCIRVHKHMETPGGIISANSVLELDPAKVDQYDYFTAELKKAGIYHALSQVFRMQLPEGDRDKVLAYDEIMKPRRDADGNVVKGRDGTIRRSGNTYGFSSFARDVQDIHIQQAVNILNHRNPYTGLRYAEDPALAYVELRNEDSIFWYSTQAILLGAPTYQRKFCERFSDWLQEKYGTHAALKDAWGERAFNCWDFCYPDEHLDSRDIFPICNAWWFSPEGLANQEEAFGAKRRLLDTARFLYEVQSEFYKRYVKAIRDTGFRGAIVGSCWQAGSGVPHYLNLHTDYEVGFIDRHEYYGSGAWGGNTSLSGASPLASPGTGSLLEAFVQVADRPFGLSEWIGVDPYPWAADGPPMIAAYGFGLQGWDASFEFASQTAQFSGTTGGRWNVQRPTQLGQYPTIARMVYRGDVREGPIVSVRNVHVPSLLEGKLGFVEEYRVGQSADFNAIRGDIPTAAVAAGRIVIEFTDEFEETKPFDLSKYVRDGVVRSATGQLEWTPVEKLHGYPRRRAWYDQQGFFTINTPGTKGVVGFAPKRPYDLGGVTIEPDNLFAVILVTAASKEGTIAGDARLLISAVARSKNTGARYQPAMTMNTVERGEAPVLMEPVRASIRIGRAGEPTVHVLDHDGRRTGRTLPVQGGSFTIDGSTDRTLYYEVVYR